MFVITVAEVLQEAWFAREQLVDVLRSEVDAAHSADRHVAPTESSATA
jgi:hypothetical protein